MSMAYRRPQKLTAGGSYGSIPWAVLRHPREFHCWILKQSQHREGSRSALHETCHGHNCSSGHLCPSHRDALSLPFSRFAVTTAIDGPCVQLTCHIPAWPSATIANLWSKRHRGHHPCALDWAPDPAHQVACQRTGIFVSLRLPPSDRHLWSVPYLVCTVVTQALPDHAWRDGHPIFQPLPRASLGPKVKVV